jgi:hypothetical protein
LTLTGLHNQVLHTSSIPHLSRDEICKCCIGQTIPSPQKQPHRNNLTAHTRIQCSPRRKQGWASLDGIRDDLFLISYRIIRSRPLTCRHRHTPFFSFFSHLFSQPLSRVLSLATPFIITFRSCAGTSGPSPPSPALLLLSFTRSRLGNLQGPGGFICGFWIARLPCFSIPLLSYFFLYPILINLLICARSTWPTKGQTRMRIRRATKRPVCRMYPLHRYNPIILQGSKAPFAMNRLTRDLDSIVKTRMHRVDSCPTSRGHLRHPLMTLNPAASLPSGASRPSAQLPATA